MKITFEDMNGMNIPRYCRKIMKEDYPETLEIYRGDMLCLTVDVDKASQLTLNENTLVYGKYNHKETLRLEGLKKAIGLGH